MEWKNWSSHPVIVGVGIIIAVITLVNTLYKDHVKSGDSPSPSPSPITSLNTPVFY
jgi:putative effector of murein hydrolase